MQTLPATSASANASVSDRPVADGQHRRQMTRKRSFELVLSVEKNVALNPVDLGLLRAPAIMLEPDFVRTRSSRWRSVRMFEVPILVENTMAIKLQLRAAMSSRLPDA